MTVYLLIIDRNYHYPEVEVYAEVQAALTAGALLIEEARGKGSTVVEEDPSEVGTECVWWWSVDTPGHGFDYVFVERAEITIR